MDRPDERTRPGVTEVAVDPLLLIIGAALIIIIIIIVAVIVMYNGLVRRRLRTDETWSQIDVQLKLRHDLVPNLVAAVRDYMGFEQDVLTQVTEARANAVAAGGRGPAEAAAAEGILTGALRLLFAVVENYPALQASENVGALQGQLETTENRIAAARDGYNVAVREYNTALLSDEQRPKLLAETQEEYERLLAEGVLF